MKKYSLFFAVLIAAVSFFASCSEIDDLTNPQTVQQQEGVYTYSLHLNGDAPNFDGATTRATSSNWASGSVIYLRFLKSGTSSTYISGQATYNGSSWTFTTTSALQTTSSNTSCSAVYVENPASTNSSTINLTPSSVAFKGTGTYTCSSSDIYVNVTLSPMTARLRFKGSSGTSITLPGDKNDIKYISSISLSSLSETTAKSDVSLNVSSNGYTPYVYGNLTNASSNNTIYVSNNTESNNYQLTTFAGGKLPVGSSGYLSIPTNSNYNSLGWVKVDNIDKNAYVIPNLLVPFTDGFCFDYSMGSTAVSFYSLIFRSLDEYENDEQIINELTSDNTLRNVEEYREYASGDWGEWYDSNSTYYYCTVAYNSSGVRGPLKITEFKTNSTSLPVATLSNMYSSSGSWKCSVTLNNGAKKYYYSANTSTSDEHFRAFYTYESIKEGTMSDYMSSNTSVSFKSSASYYSILTYAVDNNGNIGNYSYINSSSSSSNARSVFPNTNSNKNSNKMSVVYSEPKAEYPLQHLVTK